jgi:hypothetical protein
MSRLLQDGADPRRDFRTAVCRLSVPLSAGAGATTIDAELAEHAEQRLFGGFSEF